ncbi:apotyrosinase chaperone MelC1 [Streptomyces roseifaciens]|uniref:apotyrosinase chaperone MelC1 n=1 Tax=Streptomyces roseifaciens TaxID=1488406 RepID=UPI000718227D|nr:tyrosinase family oxidase copper chaperone [Streptomyces roseifaciens]
MSDLTRRRMLGRTAAAAAGIVLAGPAAQAFAAESGHDHHGNGSGHRPFDEIYEGRRIEGRLTSGSGGHHDFGIAVFVDGRPLHIMPRGNGWISVMNHYEVFASPYEVTRAAVRALRGVNLV